MPFTEQNSTTAHPLERFLAILGAAACLLITIVIWRSVSAYQNMWPLPALYLIELPAVSLVAALMLTHGGTSVGFITWAAVGVLVAFSFVGAFSIGFFYLPVALLFLILSIAHDVRCKQHVLAHIGGCLLAALAQAAIMFGAIQLLYPTAVF